MVFLYIIIVVLVGFCSYLVGYTNAASEGATFYTKRRTY